MKESVILQSPHAVDPLKCLTEEEKPANKKSSSKMDLEEEKYAGSR